MQPIQILSIQNYESHPSLSKVKPGFDRQACAARMAWLPTVNAEWWAVSLDAIVVGWMILSYSGKPTHPEYPNVSDLFVHVDYRGQGIGTGLLYYAESRVADMGYPKIGLAVNPTLNPQAFRLYKRLGYSHDGGPSYLDGVYDGDEDWVIDLEKSLRSSS